MRLWIWVIVFAVAGSVSRADILPLDEISRYLDGIRTAEARFTQLNDDGTQSAGRLYIKRPGRMRFEYDPPEEAIVVAGANTVVIYDPRSNQGPEQFPLRRTPLSILLADRVDLTAARMVVGHTLDGDTTVVTAQDPDNPEYGSLQLRFSANPVRLTAWTVLDSAGGRTTVRPSGFDTSVDLPNRLFNITRIGAREER